MLKSAEKFRKKWIFLLAIASALYGILSIIKIGLDQAIFEGILFLIIANTFAIAVYCIQRKKVNLKQKSVQTTVFLSMGFLFIILGSTAIVNVGIAGFGYVLFLAGLFLQNKTHRKVLNA